MSEASKIVPVIISGGAGSRLWPLSNEARPKQFHAIGGPDSLFIQTLERTKDGPDVGFSAPLIVCGQRHRDVVRAELEQAGVGSARLILEPMARNTAAALAAAAVDVARQDPDALMLVLPADHVIARPEALRAACRQAAAVASAGRIIAFGIAPDQPETGYGYIRAGADLGNGVYAIDAFVEKPDLETAKSYLADGSYAWNAGIFFFTAGSLIRELRQHAPAILAAVESAVARGTDLGADLALEAEAFEQAPSKSIDYAVMELTDQAAVVSLDMGWNDVGSFATLWEIGQRDSDGNVVEGPARAFHSTNCLVRSSHLPVAVIGLDDVMVVATETGILVAPRARAQDVRLAADAFKPAKKPD